MADDVEEMKAGDASVASKADMRLSQNSHPSRLEVSSASGISKRRSAAESGVTFEEPPEVKAKIEDEISSQLSKKGDDDEALKIEDRNKSPGAKNLRRMPRSTCRARSRDTRQCQKHFQEMIVKRETRNDELEQQEGDLRQRMEMLECSMPAVMTWNIWRMAQNTPACSVRRLLEKQFKDPGAGGVAVPSTPSQHYDCRVREIEAERKEAVRRAEEARVLLAEKQAAIEGRRKLLEDAKKCNQERREKMEKLSREAAEVRAALKNARGDDNSCESGECGEIRCKDKWLDNVGSASSIGSTDLECFAKLQELAEAEICMKRQINDLERREEAYMRTLQQADELWLKMEGDTADTVSELQDQLDSKTAANQQLADRVCSLEDELEKSKMRLVGCKEALLKFTDKKFSDVEIGFDDGEATVIERGVIAAVKTSVVSTTAAPTTADQESLALAEAMDKESSAEPESADAGLTATAKMFDKDTEADVDKVDRSVDRPVGLGIDAAVGDSEARVEQNEDLKKKALRSLRRRRSKLRELEDGEEDDEDIPEHWKNWNWDEGCPEDAICDDMVEGSTGMEDPQHPKGVPTAESKVQVTPEVVDQTVGGRGAEDLAEIEPEVVLRLTDEPEQATGIATISSAATKVTPELDETGPETDQIVLSREELRNWLNIVDSLHHLISKCVNCSSKVDDTHQLAERMKLHLRIQGLSGVRESEIQKEPVMTPVITTDPANRGDELESLVIKEDPADGQEAVDLKPPEEVVEVVTIVQETATASKEQLPDILPKKSEQNKDIPKKQSAEKVISELSKRESDEPKEAEEPIEEDRKHSSPEPESDVPEVADEFVVETETKAEVTNIPVDETSASPIELSEELAQALSGPENIEVPSEDSKASEQLSTEPLQVSANEVEIKQSVVDPETDAVEEDATSRTEEDSKEDARLEETAVSFVTPRTPPPSKIDVQLLADHADDMEQVSESVAEFLIKSEELESADGSAQLVTSTQSIAEPGGIPESELGPATPELRSQPDESRLELLVDKVPEKIAREERISKVPEASLTGKPHLSMTKVESREKIKLPKSMEHCICPQRTCPLLRSIAGRESELKSPKKLFTEGTQTSPRISKDPMGRLDKLKLRTITESSTWASPEVGIWRRPMVWSRRPEDKSTLTTVCVDTQTDSALVRERIALEGIDRKDRSTCSGVSPRYTGFGGCPERISTQPPSSAHPVGLAVTELFGAGPVRFPPSSMASSAEKEISDVKYEARSSMPQDSKRYYCVECGRPITPNGTTLSDKLSRSTSSKSQKSILGSLKTLPSSTISRVTGEQESFTCCHCKKPDNQKIKRDKKRSEETASDVEVCCPCPPEFAKIMSTKASKSRKKKWKPEKKDQSVMANIARSKSKPSARKTKKIDPISLANVDDAAICQSQIISLSSEEKIDSNGYEVSECDKESTASTSLSKYRATFNEELTEGDKSSINENTACNCSPVESLSREESNCCEPLRQ